MTRRTRPSARPELDERVDPELGPRRRSLAIGNCVHGALESCARRAWARPPDDEIDAILAREGIADDAEARERVEALLDNWLRSRPSLRARARAAPGRGRRCRSCSSSAGAIVRGKIDLLAESDAGPLVVDYKTDALRGVDPTELASRYETQRDLYALAVGRARGEPLRRADPRRLLLPRGARAHRGPRRTTRRRSRPHPSGSSG